MMIDKESAKKAISILKNAAWLGAVNTFEETEEAVKTAITALQMVSNQYADVSKKVDLISRADAVDACMKYNGYGTVWACIMGDIKQLPSAQPTLTNAESNTELSVDLISREDALSCFHDWIDRHGDVHTADEMPEYQRIEQLPSAQPEIIRCKDCKWFDCDWHQCRRQVCASFYMDDYCSFAERETDG